MIGPQQITWLELLEVEHDNLRAALNWALDTGEAEIALQMCWALVRFWERRGYRTEGREWVRAALALDGAQAHTVWRARALNSLALLAIRQGDYDQARQATEEGLAIYQELDDQAGIAQSLNNLG